MVKETGKKKVATTVETGTLLDLALEDLAGEVVRGKVGGVNVAYLARELDAALGVEQVGVDIFPELSHCPDSIFATLTLLGYLNHPSQIREFFQSLPAISFKKTEVPCANELKKTVMAKLSERIHLLEPTEINTVDGLRLESADSWMLPDIPFAF